MRSDTGFRERARSRPGYFYGSHEQYCKFWFSQVASSAQPTFYKCTQSIGNDQVFAAEWYYKSGSDDEIHLKACTDKHAHQLHRCGGLGGPLSFLPA